MTALTYRDMLGQRNIAIPAHLAAQAEIPVLSAVQRQGDLLILPDSRTATTPIPQEGVQLVVGEATGNTHWLDGAGAGYFDRLTGEEPTIGILTVPDGAAAYITHTDEHGSNGVGAGSYRIVRAREQADAIRLVAD